MSLAAFRRENPLGSVTRVVAVDAQDRYAGIIWLSDAHAAPEDVTRVCDVLHQTKIVLLPDMSVKQAVEAFERAEADALAVVDGLETQKVIGLLTEQYALRRYTEELDRRRRELIGE
jgi:CIC family chloride channel protein